MDRGEVLGSRVDLSRGQIRFLWFVRGVGASGSGFGSIGDLGFQVLGSLV